MSRASVCASSVLPEPVGPISRMLLLESSISSLVRLIDRKSTRLNSSHTVIYTLSLHDALPIYEPRQRLREQRLARAGRTDQQDVALGELDLVLGAAHRSEEHTSELQSHRDLHSFPTRRSSDL